LPLTGEQKKILFITAAVPMIGFGFMDNMVMITMGKRVKYSYILSFSFSLSFSLFLFLSLHFLSPSPPTF
jgi:hypothetical protein